MKRKLYLFLLLSLLGTFSVSADSGTSSFSWVEDPADPTTGCPNTTSHSDTHQGIPNVIDTIVALNGGPRTCTTHLYYSASDTIYPASGRYNQGTIRNCPAGQRVVALQKYNAGVLVTSGSWDQYTITCRNWDDSSPIVSYTLAGGTTTNNTWTNSNVTASINCNDTVGALAPGESRSGCTGEQYRRQTTPFSCDSTGTWNNGTSYTFAPAAGTNTIEYICFRSLDVAGNPYNYSAVAIVKIDKTNPNVLTDLQNLNNSATGYLANNTRNITFRIDENNGSPIVLVQGYFENTATDNTYTRYSSDTDLNPGVRDTLSVTWNQSLVDNDATPTNGFRDYNFQVTYIEDEAGNRVGIENSNTTVLRNFSPYRIYANTNITESVVTNPFSSMIIADGSRRDFIVRLRDNYGNRIIPVLGINREITLNINSDNFLRLNQYANNGNTLNDSAFFIDITTGTGRVGIGTSTVISLGDRPSTTGDYTIPMYIFAPTNTAYNLTPGSLNINNVSYRVIGDIGGTVTGTFPGSTITISAQPIYTTSITGVIRTQGFIEGVSQTGSQIIVTQTGATSPSGSLYFEFGNYNTGTFLNEVNNRYNLSLNSGGNIREGFMGGNPTSTMVSGISLLENNFPLNSRMLLQSGAVNTATTSYLASIISYTLGGKNIVYPSDIIGKTAYHGTIGNNNSYQAGVKILGNTASKNVEEIVTDQFDGDVRILGNIEKSLARKDIQTRVYELIKNITLPSSGGVTISSVALNTSIWSDIGQGKSFYSGDALYFGTGVRLQSASDIEGIKTLVVEGDIYIQYNIIDADDDAMLGIIALSKNGQGGNIYIHPRVTDIHAVLYADKSIMSAEDSNANGYIEAGEEFDGNNSNAAGLSNQLYIKGSIFSENTIGGSRKIPVVCPYFVNTGCNTETAQKYDLNYLRRYFIYDYDGDSILEPATTQDRPANGGSRSIGGGIGSGYETYPVIIDYNPLIQQTPPPFFGN